jgi:hypothetical protein
LRPQQLKQIYRYTVLSKASSGVEIITVSELVNLAYSLRVYRYEYSDAIKEIMVLIAMNLQDSSEELSGQQVFMVLNGLKKMSNKYAEVIWWLRFVVRDVYLSAYQDATTTTATGKRVVKGGEEWLLLKYFPSSAILPINKIKSETGLACIIDSPEVHMAIEYIEETYFKEEGMEVLSDVLCSKPRNKHLKSELNPCFESGFSVSGI